MNCYKSSVLTAIKHHEVSYPQSHEDVVREGVDLAHTNFEESNLWMKRELRETESLTVFKTLPWNLLILKKLITESEF